MMIISITRMKVRAITIPPNTAPMMMLGSLALDSVRKIRGWWSRVVEEDEEEEEGREGRVEFACMMGEL